MSHGNGLGALHGSGLSLLVSVSWTVGVGFLCLEGCGAPVVFEFFFVVTFEGCAVVMEKCC